MDEVECRWPKQEEHNLGEVNEYELTFGADTICPWRAPDGKLCGGGFNSTKDFESHESHHSSTEWSYPCPLHDCNYFPLYDHGQEKHDWAAKHFGHHLKPRCWRVNRSCTIDELAGAMRAHMWWDEEKATKMFKILRDRDSRTWRLARREQVRREAEQEASSMFQLPSAAEQSSELQTGWVIVVADRTTTIDE